MSIFLQYFCAFLIACGGFLTVIGGVRYRRIILRSTKLPGKRPRYFNAIKNISLMMIAFFAVGYIIGFVDIVTTPPSTIFYFIGIVFFVAGLFVFFLIQYMGILVDALHDKNETLQAEVEERIREIMSRDNLLTTVNKTTAILMASTTEDFSDALWRCMGMIAKGVDVDRMYIWKNHEVDGELYCTQLYEWSEEAEPQQGNELTVDIPYNENIPGWEKTLSSGQSVKGLVKNLSVAEQEQLSPQGIISILVVPVFLAESFWGFVGFDDCRRERDFSEPEEAILRSASLLIATSLLRNDLMLSLLRARDDANSSAQAKSDFLSNMSHEIRTPINAITGMSAIARESDDMNRVQDCLNKIDMASRQLLGLINDILDMSKIEAGKMNLSSEAFDLHAALHNVKSIIGVKTSEKHQAFDIYIAPDVPDVVIGDEMRLTQILLNLLSNAVKFTPEQGVIELRAGLISRVDNMCELQIVVYDNGIGISQEQQGRLFQAFEQAEKNTSRRFGGTGLGLAISRRIAQLMDGEITVASSLGEGSRFTVRVRLAVGSSGMLEKTYTFREETISTLAQKTILLVEDIEINREIVISLLEEKGARVVCAEDGRQALELFNASPDVYDLILMDVFMPVMNGLDATRAIRGLAIPYAAEIPIIAMTANAFEEDVQQCRDAGMNAHIAKPIEVDRFFETLIRYIA